MRLRSASSTVATCSALELAVIILTRKDAVLQRESARETWAQWADPCAARFWFLLGDAPATSVNGDILYLNVSEGYNKISLKVLHALRWLVERQPLAFRYVLKTDDDSFVCVGGMLRMLRAASPSPLYAGKPNWQHTRIFSSRLDHKWYDRSYIDTFGRSEYGDYHMGVGYLLGTRLASAVVQTAHRLGVLENASRVPGVEDAWIGALARATGLLAERRSLHDSREPTIPIALNVPLNVSASCGTDYLIVHKLHTPALLQQCARLYDATPPPCELQFGPRTSKPWQQHHDQPCCACSEGASDPAVTARTVYRTTAEPHDTQRLTMPKPH
jgi:hypothetical protein